MENEKLSMELTVQQWNVVMHALAQRPFSEVVEIITLLKSQGDKIVSANKHEDAINSTEN